MGNLRSNRHQHLTFLNNIHGYNNMHNALISNNENKNEFILKLKIKLN